MKVLVAGLPKTGTTALMYLIANSLPPVTRKLMEPDSCPSEFLDEPGDAVAKILIKPKVDFESFSRFEKKIAIVRDPRDRMVSDLLYSQFHAPYLDDNARVSRALEALRKKESSPGSVPFIELVRILGELAGGNDPVKRHMHGIGQKDKWFHDAVDRLAYPFLYHYEDFVAGRYRVIEQYLGVPLIGDAKVPDGVRRVVRTKSSGDWRNWFTAVDIEVYRPLLSPELHRQGYGDDWTISESPVIDQQHCSAYFLRLVDEYREDARKKPQMQKTIMKSSFSKEARSAGRLGRVTPEAVAGWAFAHSGNQPLEVELWVNGTLRQRAVADKPRPNLKIKGVHPSGECGFIFRLKQGEQLRPGDKVDVKPVGEMFSLTSSPRILQVDPDAGAGRVRGEAPNDRTGDSVAQVRPILAGAGKKLQKRPTTVADTNHLASDVPVVPETGRVPGNAAGSLALEPFFILGCVRSGTTMLRDILRHHPNLVSPEETHFYRWAEPFHTPEFDARYRNAGVLKKHREIDGITEDEFLQIYKASTTRRDFMIAYMQKFLAVKGAQGKRWYDKTPQNVYGLPLLMADFPDAKFVHIVRNPLDVVASLRIGKVMKIADLVGAANYWRESVEIISVIKARFPERFIEFRYEDFALDPLPHLEQLTRFVGEDFTPDHFSLFKVKSVSHAEKNILGQDEQELVRSICFVQMDRFKYCLP